MSDLKTGAPLLAAEGRSRASTDALVVFHGFGQGFWARFFGRTGFRHCFVCLAHQGTWLRLDFRDGLPALELVCADTFDLADFYRAAGLTVVETDRRRPVGPPLWPFMSATCVGAVKRVLGIGAPLIQTPLQLHNFLVRETSFTTLVKEH